jgi:hypothetical protein
MGKVLAVYSTKVLKKPGSPSQTRKKKVKHRMKGIETIQDAKHIGGHKITC